MKIELQVERLYDRFLELHVTVDLAPNGVPLGAKPNGNMQLQLKIGLLKNWVKKNYSSKLVQKITLCVI